MTYREILSRVDHTLLKQGATWEQIEAVCDDGLRFGTASVCIPPSFVKQAAEYLKGRLPVCTVIGFPNGYNTTAVKVYETAEAVGNGADEIDMVVNLGWVKEGRYDRVLEEINAVKKACAGRLLKVIIETCLNRRRKDRALQDCHQVRCRIYKDLHGLFRRRRHLCGCGADEGTDGGGKADQGRRRHQRLP